MQFSSVAPEDNTSGGGGATLAFFCLLSIVENHRKILTIVFRTKDSGAFLHTHIIISFPPPAQFLPPRVLFIHELHALLARLHQLLPLFPENFLHVGFNLIGFLHARGMNDDNHTSESDGAVPMLLEEGIEGGGGVGEQPRGGTVDGDDGSDR